MESLYPETPELKGDALNGVRKLVVMFRLRYS